MDIIKYVVDLIASQFKIPGLHDRWESISNLGKAHGLSIPPELLALNIDILSRSWYNSNVLQPHSDWVWPFWVEKQYNREDASFLPSSYLSINLTHRNWTAISSPGSDNEAIVDPRGLVTPLYDGWSVDFWIRRDDYVILPSKLDRMSQFLVNYAPIVKSVFFKKGVKTTAEAMMHGEPDGSDGVERRFVVCHYAIEPLEAEKIGLSAFIAIRPCNPESIVPVFSIEYLKDVNAFLINGRDRLFLSAKPDRVICANQDSRDAYFAILTDHPDCLRAEDKGGLCTAFAEFKTMVDPANFFSLKAVIPLGAEDGPRAGELSRSRFNLIRNSVLSAWEEIKKDSLRISVPDSELNKAFESSKNNLLVLLDAKELPPGPFTYHKMWFRDAAYSITALLKMGFFRFVRRVLDHYFERQRPNGYFMSQQGEWDSNGEVLWTISQYVLFTGDGEFFKTRFKALRKAVEWIFATRQTGKESADTLHAGLLPPGLSAEHFGPANYYYWDNFWGYAGIRDFLRVSKLLGLDTGTLGEENDRYLEDILSSIRRKQELMNERYIPSSPYRRKDSSIIGSVSAVYPLQIIDPAGEDMSNTLRIIRKKHMENDAFFHRLLHSGYNVYLTAQVAECYLMQRSPLLFPVLEWILHHATGTWTYPEAIHPATGGGCIGDGHHGWATSEIIHLCRNMLFYERGDDLVLFPIIPHHWLDTGNTVEVSNGPTQFGRISFRLEATDDGAVLRFSARFERKPARIEFNLPAKMEKAVVNGRAMQVDSTSLSLDPEETILAEVTF